MCLRASKGKSLEKEKIHMRKISLCWKASLFWTVCVWTCVHMQTHTIKQIPWHPSTSESLESLKNSNILVTPLQGVQLPQAKAPNPHGTLRADIPQSDPGKYHCSLSTRIKDDGMKWQKSFCLQAQCSVAEWNKHCNGTWEGIREVN